MPKLDPNQDAGICMGFKAWLSCAIPTPSRRSIITPIGPISANFEEFMCCTECTTQVPTRDILSMGLLGRLHSAPELLLLYLKLSCTHSRHSVRRPAHWPDRDWRAVHILQSGYCQRGLLYRRFILDRLTMAIKLTPSRSTTKGMKKQQKVAWDPRLTMTIQYDGINR